MQAPNRALDLTLPATVAGLAFVASLAARGPRPARLFALLGVAPVLALVAVSLRGANLVVSSYLVISAGTYGCMWAVAVSRVSRPALRATLALALVGYTTYSSLSIPSYVAIARLDQVTADLARGRAESPAPVVLDPFVYFPMRYFGGREADWLVYGQNGGKVPFFLGAAVLEESDRVVGPADLPALAEPRGLWLVDSTMADYGHAIPLPPGFSVVEEHEYPTVRIRRLTHNR
jgi:hypothetical protein